eukprot:1184891-Prorocentrum_minimum.AAC.5
MLVELAHDHCWPSHALTAYLPRVLVTLAGQRRRRRPATWLLPQRALPHNEWGKGSAGQRPAKSSPIKGLTSPVADA